MSAAWTIQSLGVLRGGTWSEAYGINDKGWVVGASDWAAPGCKGTAAFVYKAGRLTNLHLRTPDPCIEYSVAFDVNASGTVVGELRDFGDLFAVMWDSTGTFSFITGGCQNAQAYGINNAGTVVGWLNDCSALGAPHPFVWTSAGGVVDALPSGYFSGKAVDITESGVIIGILDGQAARWTLGGPVTILAGSVATVGVGDLGWSTYGIGGSSVANAVGVVGGDSTQSWKYVNTFSPLAPFSPGVATDASAKRRAVGWRTQPDLRAVTAASSGGVSLLPGLAPSNAAYATAVNQCGSIAGFAPDATGQHRAVVWQISACDP